MKKHIITTAAVLSLSFLMFKGGEKLAADLKPATDAVANTTLTYEEYLESLDIEESKEEEEASFIDQFHLGDNYSVVQPIQITAADKLFRATVNKNTVTLLDSKGNKLDSKVKLADDSLTIMVTPIKPLKYGAKYTVHISPKVRIISGDYLNETLLTLKTEAKQKNPRLDVTQMKKPTLTDLQVENFIAIALKDKNSSIAKWNTGLKVALLGSPTTADKNEVAKVLKEITILTGLKSTVTTKNKANIKMYFGTHAWGQKHLGTMPANTTSSFSGKINKKYYITSSTIFINSKATSTIKKNGIRSTLTFSLGFQKENYKSGSIFNKYGKATKYSNEDKLMIKTLYSPYVPVGTTTEQLREMYRK